MAIESQVRLGQDYISTELDYSRSHPAGRVKVGIRRRYENAHYVMLHHVSITACMHTGLNYLNCDMIAIDLLRVITFWVFLRRAVRVSEFKCRLCCQNQREQHCYRHIQPINSIRSNEKSSRAKSTVAHVLPSVIQLTPNHLH